MLFYYLLFYFNFYIKFISSSSSSSSSSSNSVISFSSLSSTCEFKDASHLLSLIKERSNQRFEEGLYNLNNLIGPKLSIGIITIQYDESRNETYYQNNMNNFTAYSFAVNEYYAKQ